MPRNILNKHHATSINSFILGTCDGAAEEISLCENEVCPMETDATSLVMVIGGETSVSRENEHSPSVEILGPNGLCR